MTQNISPTPHIVVVDDDAEIQDLIRRFFVSKSYQVSIFADAETAFDAYLRNGDSWDILLTDLNLPQMSGADFTEKISRLKPELPIILITVSKSSDIAAEVISKGATDFIVKPIHFPQLLMSVERALKLKAYHTKVSQPQNYDNEKIKVHSAKGIIGQSEMFVSALKLARRVAKSKANIFINGESGTGKEVFAHFIHNESSNSKGPFIALNCSAIPETLLESELFGHAKGAFTGANDNKVGLFEEAQNGTLFLDEIGDLSLLLQSKVLRMLQEKKIKRVGENKYRTINTRIISATHKDLAGEISAGRFREDLFYRLCVIPMKIPSLRDRKDDIVLLAESFLKEFALENASPAKRFSPEAIQYLLDNPWRGNVRELENAVERAVILTAREEIGVSEFASSIMDRHETDLPGFAELGSNNFTVSFKEELPSLSDLIKKYIEFAVAFNKGAKDRTAKEIGIDRKTLYRRLNIENQQDKQVS
jgi:two-component system response regulator HydG